ncbi:RAMP superfamily CRISPR-associated protein [Pseudoalteromonas sp. R3]|uniref:RAMP superfamily CRISPR-associated protein n=1 Tax=Pseudoalteromonas sp. R3 TaxID=1709477 RepID=UPI0006B603A9|nr:RAMP superfamily CRISPR-associated protein [Pseudoalteromonas sp. R3]AZZ97518.1 hypothetical protein ELR70_10520 [Pseudoalteromonas sp. R3]
MKHYLLARLLVSNVAPMAISSGGREHNFDTQLARDANGLPYLPATSVTGVWRSLVLRELGKAQCDAIFGSSELRSSLTVSHGVVVDKQHQPVRACQSQQQLEQDDYLASLLLARPHHRERVAINDRGVAKHNAKFDQLLLPAGVRFVLTVKYEFDSAHLAQNEAKRYFAQVLSVWQQRQFALGGSTRNGLGQMALLGLDVKHVPLQKTPEHDPRTALRAFYQPDCNLAAQTKPFSEVQDWLPDGKLPAATRALCEMTVKGLDYWRFGAGVSRLKSPAEGSAARSPDILCYSEPRVTWDESGPQLKGQHVVLCGSAIKGILAHRVAFHYCRLNKLYAEARAQDSHEDWQKRVAGVDELFGHLDEQEHDNSFAGCLMVDDCEVVYQAKDIQVRSHTSLDRFTGGVRKGALYTEELLYQPTLTIRVWLANEARFKQLDTTTKQALKATLNDLEQGLLPLGAGSGRGTSLLQPGAQSREDSQMLKEIAL